MRSTSVLKSTKSVAPLSVTSRSQTIVKVNKIEGPTFRLALPRTRVLCFDWHPKTIGQACQSVHIASIEWQFWFFERVKLFKQVPTSGRVVYLTRRPRWKNHSLRSPSNCSCLFLSSPSRMIALVCCTGITAAVDGLSHLKACVLSKPSRCWMYT